MDMNTLINVVFVLLIVWFVYTRFGPTKGLRTLREGDFRKEIEASANHMLVDVREPSEFQSGFIPGARNIPLSQLGRRLGEIPEESSIYLYCRSGMRSKSAARMLKRNGYTKLAHLQGGISAWRGNIAK
ncbi:MAG TPA: rhodanese-like domain-containing protein [Paenibacillus sp.]|uniref:rhodanese-like domain-containing protein n=1 Tax=Paenibacillus sp. TaxID=58172 RepID=UPI002BCF9D3F|nr:rhodanese-like domain-containing protein [Paenibacillus sp.]HUC93733.1 rhodanese-like domain-containing protein [Paenibacillus sp.]